MATPLYAGIAMKMEDMRCEECDGRLKFSNTVFPGIYSVICEVCDSRFTWIGPDTDEEQLA
jgi:hypothetical protein